MLASPIEAIETHTPCVVPIQRESCDSPTRMSQEFHSAHNRAGKRVFGDGLQGNVDSARRPDDEAEISYDDPVRHVMPWKTPIPWRSLPRNAVVSSRAPVDHNE
jgi:hypothetical protein